MVVIFSLSEIQRPLSSDIDKLKGDDGGFIAQKTKQDKKTSEQGALVNDALNQGVSNFTPDLLYEHLVKSYASAKQLLGPKLLRYLSGYSMSSLEKNLRIPEFKKELRKNIDENVSQLKKDGILTKDFDISHKGVETASVLLAVQELDNISSKGFMSSKRKEVSAQGSVVDFRNFKKSDSYKDIAIRKSVRKAVKRNHKKILFDDLRSKVRKSKSSLSVIYAVDASASMRGKKLEMAKKAGVALSYKAIDEKDKVGLVVFNQEIQKSVVPCSDFQFLLQNIASVTSFSQTDFSLMVKKAVELFENINDNKHLIILTDAMPTVGKNPEEETLKAISIARANNISVSLVGINLDEKGKAIAEKIIQIGEGRLYLASNIEDLDIIVLEDYLSA